MRTVRLGPGGVTLLAAALVLLATVGTRWATTEGPVLAAVDAQAAGVTASPVASPLAATPAAATPISVGNVHRVDIVADDYEPGGLRVRVGDTVRWVNRDGVTHTVTASDGSFSSGPMHRGGVFSHTFTEAGTYRYECDLHLEMSGAVVASGT